MECDREERRHGEPGERPDVEVGAAQEQERAGQRRDARFDQARLGEQRRPRRTLLLFPLIEIDDVAPITALLFAHARPLRVRPESVDPRALRASLTALARCRSLTPWL